MTQRVLNRLSVVCVFLCGIALICCQKSSSKRMIVIPFKDIWPRGLERIEDGCRDQEWKTVLGGSQDSSQDPGPCIQFAVLSLVITELCGRVDAGRDECLPLLRFKDGQVTLETQEATYVVTQLERIYP